MLKKICLAFAISLCFCACSEDSDDFGQTSRAIIHGDPAPDEAYGNIISLSLKTGSTYYSYCSGILIQSDAILTAAHCVTDDPELPFTDMLAQHRIVAIAAQNAETPDPSRVFEIDHVTPHHLYNKNRYVHDLAIVTLKSKIPSNIAAPIDYLKDINQVRQALVSRDDIEFVGFGYDENDKYNNRLRINGKIFNYCTMIKNTEDCKIRSSDNVDLILPVGTMIHDLEKGGPCIGDSGGPVLIDVNGEKKLIGIVSYGDQNCSVYAVSSSVPDHQAWIDETLHPKEEKKGCSANVLNTRENFSVFYPILLFLFGIFVTQTPPKRRHRCQSILHNH